MTKHAANLGGGCEVRAAEVRMLMDGSNVPLRLDVRIMVRKYLLVPKKKGTS